MNVFVSPYGKSIEVDGRGLCFDFTSPSGFQILQWNGDHGYLTFDNGETKVLTIDDYETLVAPYVLAFEAEKARLDSCPGHFYEWNAEQQAWVRNEEVWKASETESLKSQLNALDIESVRPLRAMVDGTATDFDQQKLQEINIKAADLRRRLAELAA